MRARARARLLRRLARLCARGVPLPEALGALALEHPQLRAAAQAAAEGASVDAALALSDLLAPGDLELLRASREQPGLALELLAADAAARVEVGAVARDLLARPIWKAAVVVQLGCLVFATNGAVALHFRDPVRWAGQNQLLAGVGLWLFLTSLLQLGPYLALRSRIGRRALDALGRRMVLAGPLLAIETRARFFGVLGTSLAGGLSLPAALARVRQAFGARGVAEALVELEASARQGAGLLPLVRSASFLDATSAWLVEAAVERPDLPGELLALSAAERRRLVHEAARWAPLLGAATELSTLILLAWFGGALFFVAGFF